MIWKTVRTSPMMPRCLLRLGFNDLNITANVPFDLLSGSGDLAAPFSEPLALATRTLCDAVFLVDSERSPALLNLQVPILTFTTEADAYNICHPDLS